MNFNQLKYIVAVDKHRNFARAADECEIAQSTLSKEIQRLEKEFKIMIFDRSRHPVAPTMKGVDLIQQAKNIIEEEKLFIEIAQKMNNLPQGSFRLGILPVLAPYILPLFVHSLKRKYPDLNVHITELTAKEIMYAFENDELDASIAIAPFIKEGFYEETLFKESFVLYVGNNHPFLNQKEINWLDIQKDELLLHEEFRHALFPDDKKEIEISRNIHTSDYQSGSLETMRKIIDRNGGITLLPKLACLYMGERRLEMVRPIINPTLSRTITLVTPRGFEKNRITKVIRQELLASLPGK